VLRIAVLGCGRIGQMHAANVARHSRAELVAVFHVNRQPAERVALAQGVAAAGRAEEVFPSNKVDAVLIATATPTHAACWQRGVADTFE
jgi:myo-inositol 2-dehydrogenase / D-chiro-inositol 1-dehydrogenase